MTREYETSAELKDRGIPYHAQAQARSDGVLPFTHLGADSYSYRQADVVRWLTSGSASAASARRPTAPTSAPAPARQASAPGSPLAEWQSRMAKLCGGGTPVREAVVYLDGASPGLRRAAIDEANKARRAAHRAAINEATERRAARSQLS